MSARAGVGAWAAHWSMGPPDLAQRFNALTPADVTALLETRELSPSGSPVSAGSVENRVYVATLAGGPKIVVKLYRPGRWTRAGLLDELSFIAELRAEGVAVVEPLALRSGEQLGRWRGIEFAVFEHIPEATPWPQLHGPEGLRELGRLAAQIHAVGARRLPDARMWIEPRGYGEQNLALLARGPLIPADLRAEYCRIAERLIARSIPMFEGLPLLRVHGDFGIHNLLRGADGLVVADFDDFAVGPALFDLSQLHRGLQTPWGDPNTNPDARARTLRCFIEGYRERAPLPDADPRLPDALRGLRLIWNDAWKQARLHDPHFCRVRKAIYEREFWLRRLATLEALSRRV